MNSVTILRLGCAAPGGWSASAEPLNQCLHKSHDTETRYLLMQNDTFSTGQSLTQDLSQYFQIPHYLLSEVYRRSNGFFTFKESFDDNGRLQSCHMWFRALVKTLSKNNPSSYKWHEMTFCFRWDLGRCVVLCIGIDPTFQSLLQDILRSMWPLLPPKEPFSMLVPLIEVIIALHDQSVWSIRDVIRRVEKDRISSKNGPDDFVWLHEAARHAIHSFETLSVSVETVEALLQQTSDLSKKLVATSGNTTDGFSQIKVHIESQMRMLRNLLLRSQANKERLQNEIALAYNMIAQRDSRVMKGLGKAARQDSGAMRTIAVVTMAFLPPTFLSAIFSMSFFNYTPGQDNQNAQWSVSEKFWVYWAFAIPLTCLTLGIWFWRQRQLHDAYI